MRPSELRVNGNRLNRRIAELAEFGAREGGGIDRVAFSDADIEGRRYAMNIMRNAGLNVRVDPAGNIFGRREGTQTGLGSVLFGSHIDTVPNGGAYDGAVGSLAAIEIAHTLTEAGYRNRHPLEVAIWCDEEGGMAGSSGFVGQLSESDLTQAGHDGIRLADKIRRIGGDPARIADARPVQGSITAYLELHVEQGSVLHSAGTDIAVVEGFVGIHHYDILIEGAPNHAGTTPMDRRRNALLTGAELVLTVDRIVRETEGTQVGTVGRLLVEPGVPNVVPGKVDLTVELRHLDNARIDELWNEIEVKLAEISARHGTVVKAASSQRVAGTLTDPAINSLLREIATELNLSCATMPSGAGHDAQKLATICPTGMVFVPSVGGISHSPEEFTEPGDVENGANLLLQTILELDQE